MDQMVLKTQEWLNQKYGGKTGYVEIDLSKEAGIAGNTGWTTIYALTRAFQIELGITQTANSFGPTTVRLFQEQFKNGITKPSDESAVCGKYGGIYGIIQGALWCKGYSAHYGSITENFDSGTAAGIQRLKTDAGMETTDETITLNVMKALLSMKQYVLVRDGSEKIQTIQRYFNRNYEDYIGLAPCDGLYGRDMCQALIKVLQAIEGYSVKDATGNFGSGTKSKLPMLPQVTNPEATYLFRSALYCNGYDVELKNEWGSDVEEKTKEFQGDMMLMKNGRADTNTWMALMISRGNPERPSNGCDTRFEMTLPRINLLKSKQYEVVGRYLTGGSFKELREGEPERIINNGLKFFPIFQESGADMDYFTAQRGKLDAEKSSRAARKFGIPKDTIIYFAVDTDPLDSQITSRIIPYFEALYKNFDPDYRIGVYGTRNTCTKVTEKGYAVASFVADMSYGFSGNMGFKIPSNWSFDQYYEIKTSESGWDFDLDKTTYSKRFPVVDHLEHRHYVQPSIPSVSADMPSVLSFIEDLRQLETIYKEQYDATIGSVIGGTPLLPSMLVLAITNFLRSQEYFDWEWDAITGHVIDNGFVSDIQNKYPALYDRLIPYIRKDSPDNPRKLISDGEKGIIDFAHFAATLEAYLTSSIFPRFWASWGGDLATGMNDTTVNISKKYETDSIYYGKTDQEIADATIGKATLSCNYCDLCSDFDAYKIAQILKEVYENSTDETTFNFHLLSDTLQSFYTSHANLYTERFRWILEELGCSNTVGTLKAAIKFKMNTKVIGIGDFGAFSVMDLKGGNPSQEVADMCCDSFANYIYKMLEA